MNFQDKFSWIVSKSENRQQKLLFPERFPGIQEEQKQREDENANFLGKIFCEKLAAKREMEMSEYCMEAEMRHYIGRKEKRR